MKYLRAFAILLAVGALSISRGIAQPPPQQERLKVIEETLWESIDYLAKGEPDPYRINAKQQFAGVLGREDLITDERRFHLQTRGGNALIKASMIRLRLCCMKPRLRV